MFRFTASWACTLAVFMFVACSDDGDVQKDAGKPDLAKQIDVGVDTLMPDQGVGPNSGTLCTGKCDDPLDICAYMTSGAKSGMCLKTCNSGDQCPKPKGPYASMCAFKYTGSTSGLICGWFCEHQGVTYKCPDATNYDCKALDSTQPSTKFCVPK